MENVFSPAEQEILDILGRRKMTIAEITKKYFYQRNVLDGNNYVAMCVRRINRKCVFYKMTWVLKGEGTGRHGKKIWKEKRGKHESRRHRKSVSSSQ